jgi:hypothetical protein
LECKADRGTYGRFTLTFNPFDRVAALIDEHDRLAGWKELLAASNDEERVLIRMFSG